jgi:hypothetical protein
MKKLSKAQEKVLRMTIAKPIKEYGHKTSFKALVNRGLVESKFTVSNGTVYFPTAAALELLGIRPEIVEYNHAVYDLSQGRQLRHNILQLNICRAGWFGRETSEEWKYTLEHQWYQGTFDEMVKNVAEYQQRAARLALAEMKIDTLVRSGFFK